MWCGCVQGGEFWKGCGVVGAVPAGSPCSVKCGHTGAQWRFPKGLQYRSKQSRLGRNGLAGTGLGRKLCRL